MTCPGNVPSNQTSAINQPTSQPASQCRLRVQFSHAHPKSHPAGDPGRMHTPTLWVPHLVQLSCQMGWGAWADSQGHLCFGRLSVNACQCILSFLYLFIYWHIPIRRRPPLTASPGEAPGLSIQGQPPPPAFLLV